MSDAYVFAIEGLEELGRIEDLKPKITTAAYRAINKTLDRGRTMSAREMRSQVNFPGSYLQGASSRLNVTQRANEGRLEGVISGRRRATSLARFVVGSKKIGKAGVRVSVKPGSSAEMTNAFLMKIRGGNLGLAIRVKKGGRPDKAYKPVKIADGLFLLYGPSVDQVFKTVREDVAPNVERYLAAEFTRLLDVDL